jgi:hypothetical protein
MRIPFVITYTAWNALFQGKENKKKEYLAKVERTKEREKQNKVKKDTAAKSSIEKNNYKRGMCFNCPKSVKLTDLTCLLCSRPFHKKS